MYTHQTNQMQVFYCNQIHQKSNKALLYCAFFPDNPLTAVELLPAVAVPEDDGVERGGQGQQHVVEHGGRHPGGLHPPGAVGRGGAAQVAAATHHADRDPCHNVRFPPPPPPQPLPTLPGSSSPRPLITGIF